MTTVAALPPSLSCTSTSTVVCGCAHCLLVYFLDGRKTNRGNGAVTGSGHVVGHERVPLRDPRSHWQPGQGSARTPRVGELGRLARFYRGRCGGDTRLARAELGGDRPPPRGGSVEQSPWLTRRAPYGRRDSLRVGRRDGHVVAGTTACWTFSSLLVQYYNSLLLFIY
jgi:hypothetical protein